MDRRSGYERRLIIRIDPDRRDGDDRRQNKKVIFQNDRRGRKEITSFRF
ncbi:MAG: hypothetical protein ISR91_07245 [Candidatus Delongbacteria bacterium]|nr:hypothetical protein [Candidatus Delongbacteria bacterium]